MRKHNSFFISLAFVLITMFLWTGNLFSSPTTIYGPRKFTRSTGKPVVVTETFSAPSAATYNLIVFNGEKGKNRVSSAIVKINGIEILKESDFNQQVDRIERIVSLPLSNTISVELKSSPGSFITIVIECLDCLVITNHPPVAQNQSLITDQDVAKAITLIATDSDSDPLTYQIVTQPVHGTLSGTPPGVTYTPAARYFGTDSFTFKANDGKLDSNVATVSITVNHVNHPPVAQNQNVTTDEDMAKAITLGATDPDGDTLTYTIVAPPGRGTLTGTPPNVAYTPTAHYYGSDSFIFKANDGKLDSNIATVSIIINYVNHAPVAQDQAITTSVDTAKVITLTATDVDGDRLAYQIMAQPLHGTLSGTVPNLTYTPAPQYSGSDGFTFKANDGKVDSNIATVSIIVRINHAPVAQNQCVMTGEDTTKAITLVVTDVDGDPLTYEIVDQPTHGKLSGTLPNVIYTPAAGYFGPDAFTFKANDGWADSNMAWVSIAVDSVVTHSRITTVAGTGMEFYRGDGEPATNAVLHFPNAVAADLSGSLYIVEYTKSRIRKVDTSGIVTTVAGDGTAGYDGDGGPATKAKLNMPEAIAVDGSGNLYIADTYNRRIRKVDTNGIITTIAGNGIGPTFRPDGGFWANDVDKSATQTTLWWPRGIAVDASGNIFISETPEEGIGGRIRKIDTKGIIITVADAYTFSWPRSIALDALGNLYVADLDNVGKLDTKGTLINVIQNRSYSDQFDWLAVGASGNLYAIQGGIVVKVDTNGIITTVAGKGPSGYGGDGGPATEAQLNCPQGIAVDASGNLYIADTCNARIRKVDKNGTMTTMVGGGTPVDRLGEGGPAIEAELDEVNYVAVDASGNLYLSDHVNGRVRKIDSCGIITTIAGNGTDGYSGDGGPSTQAQLYGPRGVAVDMLGNVYIAEGRESDGRVRKVHRNGIIATVARGLYWPEGLAVDASGNLYIADSFNHRIKRLDTSGVITTVAGSGPVGYQQGAFGGDNGPATAARLNYPCDVALDAFGNLYIADSGNDRIRRVDTNGIITTVAGGPVPSQGYGASYSGDGGPATNAMLNTPAHVAVDPMGNLYISDGGNHRIRKVDTKGIITTVVGNGYEGYSGDSASSAAAGLEPRGIAFDSSGNLYISTYMFGGSPYGSGVSGNRGITHIRKVVGLSTITSSIFGKVTDSSKGLPIWNNLGEDQDFIRITLTDSLNTTYEILPGVDGAYGVSGLPTGAFTATFVGRGYFPQTITGTLGPGEVQTHDIKLTPFSLLELTITSPQDGPIVNSSPVSVTGSVTNDANVTVNGIGASVSNATFSVSIPLTEGINEITATATDPYGQTTFVIANISLITGAPKMGIITTVAGNGTAGYSGDGGLATQAKLYGPSGVGVDAFGNFFIVDYVNSLVRRVDTGGIITTIAGGGNPAVGVGEGGPATQAGLRPFGVAVDTFGNFYIAERWESRIRKVDTNGIITTVVGGGNPVDGLGDGAPATQAKLYSPSGIAVDTLGNLYIADADNDRIRKVDMNGIITTVAGGNTPPDPRIVFWGDGGPATQAKLHSPWGVAVDTLGNLYIADEGNRRIRKVDTNGTITTVAGNGHYSYSGDGGPATLAGLDPSGVAVDSQGNLYIVDQYNDRIRKVDTSGIITTVAGNGFSRYIGDGGPAILAQVDPSGVAVDNLGNLYIADRDNNRIRKVEGLFAPKTAAITGKVTDSYSSLPLSNITITIKDAVNTSYSTKTSSNGTYLVSGLVPGDFTATFAQPGYTEKTVNGTAAGGPPQTLDIQLVSLWPPLTLVITSPQNGATINSSPVSVTGNISNNANVTVNGVQAPVDNNTFSASIPLSEGVNSITATATDQYGQTASQSISVNFYKPVTGGIITGTVTDSSTGLPIASATVSVRDSTMIALSEARVLAFIIIIGKTALTDSDGKYRVYDISPGPFTGTITKDGYATYNFSGTIASEQTVTINAALNPVLPVISNIAVSGITANSVAITWATDQLSDSRVEYGTTTCYGSSVRDSTLTTNHTTTLSNLISGTTYHFKVTSTNGFGLSSSSGDLTFRTSGPALINLAITFPPDGSSMSVRDTIVRGTVMHSRGSETGVVVNGILANIYGTEFVANHVPLVEGANTITATATDVDGNTETVSAILNGVTVGNYIRITSNTESGLSPLEAILTIESSLDLTRASLTYAGPEQAEFLSTSASEYRVRMTPEGIYYFTAKVTDSGGNLYSNTVAITVLSEAYLDGLLRGKWEAMRTKLIGSDIEGALVSFDESKKQDYRDLFNVLFTMLPTVVQEMSDIEPIEYVGNAAIYDIRTTRDGIEYSFQLLFGKDPYGIWKIISF